MCLVVNISSVFNIINFEKGSIDIAIIPTDTVSSRF